MNVKRLIVMLLSIVAMQMAISAQISVEALRAKLIIPDFYTKTPKEYWAFRDEYYKKSGLDVCFKTTALDLVDFIEFKTFDYLLRKEGYTPYDSQRIHDVDGEVYKIVNESAKGEPISRRTPDNAPNDTISVYYVVEIDGSVGPIYMTKGDKQNRKIIGESLRESHFDSPAKFNGKPVRSLQGFTIVTNPPRK